MQLKGWKMKSNKGFTLIEALIVVSIFGIIIAVVFDPKHHNTPFCFDGWLVHRYDRGVIHKLDQDGKPIPCSSTN